MGGSGIAEAALDPSCSKGLVGKSIQRRYAFRRYGEMNDKEDLAFSRVYSPDKAKSNEKLRRTSASCVLRLFISDMRTHSVSIFSCAEFRQISYEEGRSCNT